MSEFELRQARKVIYAKWFTGKITYDVLISEIASVNSKAR